MSDIPLGEVVIVDDDEDLLATLEGFLTLRNCTVRKATDADGCLELFKKAVPDMAMIDLGLEDPEKDGIWLLQKLQMLQPDVPVVVLSGYARLEIGVRAMRIGAFDFIEKPIMPQYLFEIIKRTIAVGRQRRICRRLRQSMRPEPAQITGSSPPARNLAEAIEQNANKNSRIMLQGAQGSGKRHAARCIHHLSPRSSYPFLVANCRHLPESELEKQLFGETLEKGDYIPGLFEQADGGTIYLDEVCALPMHVQSLLLGTLVRGQFSRSGGGSVSTFDVRVVSGTAMNVEQQIADGNFREDLYNRLNVVSIAVPPLDARRIDIPELCEELIQELSQILGLHPRDISTEALDLLQAMSWPGNIRQLRNLVERLLLTPHDGEPASKNDVSDTEKQSSLGNDSLETFWKMTLREARNEFERKYLITQINRHGGNISTAAHAIGMERSALHRKLKGLEVVTRSGSGGRVAGLREKQV
ncbi:MAG: sigma-54 dependent transcriptional regulator [Rhodobacteraceae bacterium]|nr:sigma-54 dependent transcriptional regulator [Paracoccaceae bacterium]